MDERVGALIRIRERAEVRVQLQQLQQRLGRGLGRLSIAEWRHLEDELETLSAVVWRARVEVRADVVLRDGLIEVWRSFVGMLEDEILPQVQEGSPPSLIQEFRLHEPLHPVVDSLGRLDRDFRL